MISESSSISTDISTLLVLVGNHRNRGVGWLLAEIIPPFPTLSTRRRKWIPTQLVASIGIQHTFWNPSLYKAVFFAKNERVKAFRKHGNVLCIDNKHDSFGCQFNSLVSEMGMGQKPWNSLITYGGFHKWVYKGNPNLKWMMTFGVALWRNGNPHIMTIEWVDVGNESSFVESVLSLHQQVSSVTTNRKALF